MYIDFLPKNVRTYSYALRFEGSVEFTRPPYVIPIDALTIATTPARTASGSLCQDSTTIARSGSRAHCDVGSAPDSAPLTLERDVFFE